MDIIDSIAPWIFYFAFYSFLGWVIEVLSIFIEERKWTNRGFLTGPFVILFGFGACFIIFLSRFVTKDVLAVFLSGVFFLSLFEYLTSFFMEKAFGARWWGYENHKFNLNGRVALFPSLIWGVLSVSLVFLIHPSIEKISYSLAVSRYGWMAASVMIAYFIADFVISFRLSSKLKDNISSAIEELKSRGSVVSLIGKTKSEKSLMIRKIFAKLPLLQRKIVFAHPQFAESIIAKMIKNHNHKS